MAAAAPSATVASTAHYKALQNSQKRRVPSSVSFPTNRHATKQHRKIVVVGNSTDEQETETAVESPKGPPSLISVLNVEKALRGLAITDVDHYGRLGLQNGCSYDQVSNAYKTKVAEVMNKGLDQEELTKELELLQESHSILSTVEERRMYDWSLGRGGNPERFIWPYEADIMQPHPGDPPPQEPEDEGPTRLTGYFFFAWLILSFTLLIAFNR